MAQLAIGVAFVAAGLLINYLFPPPKPQITGPRLNDLAVTGSSYGECIPEIWGTVRLACNITWSDDIHEVKTTKDVGGKGGMMGGGGAEQTTYEYFADFECAVCKGPVDDVLQIFADGKLIYDKTGTNKVMNVYEGIEIAAVQELQLTAAAETTMAQAREEAIALGVDTGDKFGLLTAKFGLPLRIYKGTEYELPDPLIEIKEGVGNVPGGRGVCRIVFEKMPVRNFGNRVPNIHVVVSRNTEGNILRQDPTLIGTLSSSAMAFDTRRRRLYVSGLINGSKFEYDSLTQKVINVDAQQDSVSGQFIHVSESGFVFALRPVLVGLDQVARLDPNSLEEVDRSTSGYNEPANDLDSVKIQALGLLGPLEKDVVFVSENFGGVQLYNANTLNNITPIGMNDILVGGDFSQADGVGGPLIPDRFNGVMYSIQRWTTGSADPTGPYVLWKLTPTAVDGGFGEGASAGCTFEELYRFPREDPVNGFPSPPGAGFYVKGDNSLIIAGGGHLVKFDLDTNEIVARNTDLPSFGNKMKYSNVTAGAFGYLSGSGVTQPDYYIVNINDLSLIDTGSVTVATTGAVTQNIWDEETFSVTTNQGGLRRFFLNRANGAGEALSVVVADICERAGLELSDINIADLADKTVRGFTVNRQMPARIALEELMRGFLFDAVESDYMVKFVRRGQAPVMTIPYQHMGDLIEDDGEPDDSKGRLVETRIQEADLPWRVNVMFSDIDRDYQKGTAFWAKIREPVEAVFSDSEQTLDINIVYNATEAKQIAETWLDSYWNGRSEFKTSLPWDYLLLDPNDVVVLETDGSASPETRTARISDMGVGADLVIDMKFLEEDAITFTGTLLAEDGFGFVGQLIPNSVLSQVFLMDLPLLRDVDSTAGVSSRGYFAMNGYAQPWPGGVLMKSHDGQNFFEVGAQFSGVGFGSASTLLGIGESTVWDDVNSVTFYPDDGEEQFSSATDLEVFNGANACLVGDEIIQFGSAVLNVDGSITLSHLLRGRKGTEHEIPNHAVGDRVIRLRNGLVASFTYPIADIGITKYWRPVTVSTLPENADIEQFAYTGADLRPYSVVGLSGVRAGSNLTISWERRTRYHQPRLTGVAPVNEAEEEFDVELRQNGQLIRETTVIDAKQLVYTTANWLNDTGLPAGAYVFDNSDFEDGLADGTFPPDWSGNHGAVTSYDTVTASGVITQGQAGAGTKFAVCVGNIFGEYTLFQTKHLYDDWHFSQEDLRAEPAFTLSAYTATPDANDTMELRAEWLAENDSIIRTDTTGTFIQTADGNWVQRTVTGNVPPNARKLRMLFQCTSVGGGLDVPNGAIDTVQIVIGSGVPHLETSVWQVSANVGRGIVNTRDI